MINSSGHRSHATHLSLQQQGFHALENHSCEKNKKHYVLNLCPVIRELGGGFTKITFYRDINHNVVECICSNLITTQD